MSSVRVRNDHKGPLQMRMNTKRNEDVGSLRKRMNTKANENEHKVDLPLYFDAMVMAIAKWKHPLLKAF